MFLLLLKKSVKSIQLILNEFVLSENKNYSITAGAFTKARKKFKHTAFVELNDDLVNLYYVQNDIKRYLGMRILAFDGSKITLPDSPEINKEFGTRAIGNGSEKDLGVYSRATFMSCYDILNNIAVNSILSGCESYEADLASQMLKDIKDDDLAIFDRGFAAYNFMAKLVDNNKSFIIRCPRSSFKEVQTMFNENAPNDKVVTIKVPYAHKQYVKKNNLPNEIKIRLIRIILPSGEVEVLATSLFSDISIDQFSYLYYLRWGIETFFSKLKGRLNLDNFTGKSCEAIRQDFWSTIFISNLETIMTEDIDDDLLNSSKDLKNTVKVNKAVSFNAIKNLAFDIFCNEKNKQVIFEKLDLLFRMNLISNRTRSPTRNSSFQTRGYNYQKRKRKHVY